MVRSQTINHLGIVEDYAIEKEYIIREARLDANAKLKKNYAERWECEMYLKRFARKHDRKLFLLGLRSIGGSEFSVKEEGNPDNQVDVANPNSKFNKHNVRKLFIDGGGTYNSHHANQIVAVTGAFFDEPDRDLAEIEELNQAFISLRKLSEKCGYSVLRGLKERGVSVRTSFFTSDSDTEMSYVDH